MASKSAIVDKCVLVESGEGSEQDIAQLLAYINSPVNDVSIRLRAVSALLGVLLEGAKPKRSKKQ